MPKDSTLTLTQVKQLVDKFRTNSLTGGELRELRRAVSAMSDAEIELIFSDTAGADAVEISQTTVDRITLEATRQAILSCRRRRRSRILAVAAAIALPLIAVAVAWLYLRLDEYSRYDRVLASATEITTSLGEKVAVRLPDGTEAAIGSASQLSYYIKDFTDRHRVIDADGELRLAVTHDPGCPFVVNSPGLVVRVLGTRFSMVSRRESESAMLYLEEGSVQMESTSSGETVTVRPQELAILNRTTGRFEVRSMESGNDAAALMRGDIAFSDTPLSEVVAKLSEVYGVAITVDTDVSLRRFTGYIPVNDREEAIAIITGVYHLKAFETPGGITMRPVSGK